MSEAIGRERESCPDYESLMGSDAILLTRTKWDPGRIGGGEGAKRGSTEGGKEVRGDFLYSSKHTVEYGSIKKFFRWF